MAQRYESVDLVDDAVVRRFARAVLLAALTAGLAQFSIPYPFSTAPISFQMIGAYLAGFWLGPLWGGFSMGLYLLVGALGQPIFSNGSAGIGAFAGATGGYLVGFLVAAVVIGAIVHRGIEPKRLSSVPFGRLAVALLVGLVVIYAIGVPWLAYVLGLSPTKAIVTGALVFVPGDLVKIAATLALVRGGGLDAIAE